MQTDVTDVTGMKLVRAIIAGLVGTAVVLLVVWGVGRLTHSDGDLSALAAAVVFGVLNTLTWWAGLVLQLIFGVIVAIVYAGVFEWVTRRAGFFLGLTIGIPHAILAGIGVGALPASRMIDAGIMPPGAFYEYRGGWCILGFVLAHVAFGCIVGAAYGRTRHRVPWVSRPWRVVPHPGANA